MNPFSTVLGQIITLMVLLVIALALGYALAILIAGSRPRPTTLSSFPAEWRAGRLNRQAALARIAELVAEGQALDSSRPLTFDAYFVEVAIFVHYLRLPLDTQSNGVSYATLDWFLAAPSLQAATRLQTQMSGAEKRDLVVGALRGLGRALSSLSF